VNDCVSLFSVIGWVRIIGELMLGNGLKRWSAGINCGIGPLWECGNVGVNVGLFVMGID
jgi:hypothetical protein